MRKTAPLLVAAALGIAALAGGCAGPTGSGPRFVGPRADLVGTYTAADTAADNGVARRARLKTPDDADTARAMLEGALVALDEADGARAATYLAAILRSDQLTDRGRANVYWLSAEAHRQVRDDAGEAESLAGFLVAADVVMPDAELQKRAVQARAWLWAKRLKDQPALGRTPELAIMVEDAREPGALVQSLHCGRNGQGRYVMIEPESLASMTAALVHRRAACEDDGEVLDLWFDVSRAGSPEAAR